MFNFSNSDTLSFSGESVVTNAGMLGCIYLQFPASTGSDTHIQPNTMNSAVRTILMRVQVCKSLKSDE